MKPRAWNGIAGLLALGLLLRSGATTSLFSIRYLPHRYCYLAQSGLIWTNAIADGSIATAYTVIFACLFLVGLRLRSMPELRAYGWLPFCFGLFIVTCGATHAMDVVTVWWPFYPLSATIKVLCALVSLPTTIYLAHTTPILLAKLQGLPAEMIVESRLQVILGNVVVAIVMIDGQGNIVSMNRAAAQMFEYTAEEAIGKNIKMLMAEPDSSRDDAYLPGYESASKTGITGFPGHLQGLTHAGRLFPIEITATEVSFDGQRQFIGLIRDLTEQRRAQKAEQQSAAALAVERQAVLDANSRALMGAESGHIGIWEWDLHNDLLVWDQRMYRIYGIEKDPPGPLTYTLWRSHVHPDDYIGMTEAVQNAVADTGSLNHEFRIVWSDRSVHFIKMTGQLNGTPADKSMRLVGTNTDITERKEAEERLWQSNEKQRMLIQGVKEHAILMLDPEGHILTWNEGAENIQGYTAAEIIGSHFSRFYTAEARGHGEPEEALRTARSLGRFEGESPKVKKDGTSFWADMVITALRDKDDRLIGFAMVSRDITSRKRAEEASAEAQAAAETANRTKADFLANMSHEVRTPVNAIVGLAQLAMRAEATPKVHGYLAKIDTAARSLMNIINDILDFSKMEAGKLTLERIPFSMQEVLKNLTDIVGLKAEQKGLIMSIEVASDVPQNLLGDPFRVGQVLINLVNNAIKFTDRGSVVIAVETAPEERLSISVTDTGIGMRAEQIAKLFRSFSQADTSFTRLYGGTGLGLTISKQLAEMMGGAISVQSKPGVGSTFSFTAPFATRLENASAVPDRRGNLRKSALIVDVLKPVTAARLALTVESTLHPPSASSSALTLPAAQSAALRGRTVLLVEDNDLNCLVASEMLADFGLDLTTAANGKQALDLIQTRPFDLVLMDIQMPVMDGLTATRLIRADERFRNLPILAMTAQAMTGDRERSLEAGMNDHLIKPISPDGLREALQQWLPPREPAAPDMHNPATASASVQTSELPEHLPPFDLREALLYTNENPRLLRKLLFTFREQFANAVCEVNTLLNESKLAEAERLVHSLKGLAATLAASDLARAALAVEQALRTGELIRLNTLIKTLEEQLATAIAAVSRLGPA